MAPTILSSAPASNNNNTRCSNQSNSLIKTFTGKQYETFYADITKLVNMENYGKLIDIMKVSDNLRHFDLNEYLIKKGCFAIRLENQRDDMKTSSSIEIWKKRTIHLTNFLFNYLELLIELGEYRKFQCLVNGFCDGHSMDGYLTVFINDSEFLVRLTKLYERIDVKKWSMENSKNNDKKLILEQNRIRQEDDTGDADTNDKDIDEGLEKQYIDFFLELTKTIIIYLKFDITNDSKTFTNTIGFINYWYQRFLIERDGKNDKKAKITIILRQQLKEICHSLKLFSLIIKLFQCDNDNADDVVNTTMDSIIKGASFLNNHQNSIVIFDATVTISQLLTNGIQQYLDKIINDKFLQKFYPFISQLYGILRLTNYTKTFCKFCSNIKKHEVDNLATIVYRILRKSCELNVVNETIVMQFASYYQLKCSILSTMKCENVHLLIRQAEIHLSNAFVFLFKKEHAKLAILLLLKLKSKSNQLYINESYENFNEFFLKKLFEQYYLLENYDKVIKIGCIYCIQQFIKISNLEMNRNNNNNTDYNTVKKEITDGLESKLAIICYAYRKLWDDYQLQLKSSSSSEQQTTSSTSTPITIPPPTPRKYLTSIDYNYSDININVEKLIDFELMLLQRITNAGCMDELKMEIFYNIIEYAESVCNRRPVIDHRILSVLLKSIYHVDVITSVEYELRLNKLIEIHVNGLENEELKINKILIMESKSLQATQHLLKYNRIFLQLKKSSANYQLKLENFKSNELYTEKDILNEIELIDMLNAAIKLYRQFINDYCNLTQADHRLEYEIETKSAIKYLRYIGEHLQIRNFKLFSIDAYQLLYKLSIECDDEFGQINAIAFMAENYQYFIKLQFSTTTTTTIIDAGMNQMNNKNCNRKNNHNHNNIQISFNELIEQCNCLIIKHIENLTTPSTSTSTSNQQQQQPLSNRKKCFLFYALINITLYYLHTNNYDKGKLLLKFIDKKLTELQGSPQQPQQQQHQPNQQLYTVRMLYYSIIFHWKTTFEQSSGLHSAIIFGEFILNECTNVQYVTADDTIRIPLILFTILSDITNYCLARHDVNELEPFLFMLLKFTYKLGTIFRAIDIFIALAHIYLQREQIRECKNVLKQLDSIFSFNNDYNELCDSTDKLYIDEYQQRKMEQCSAMISSDIGGGGDNYLIEPVRREALFRSLSPIRMTKNGCTSIISRYLTKHEEHCNCICCRKNLKFILFQIGSIYCRLLFIKREYNPCMKSHELLHEYWMENIIIALKKRNFQLASAAASSSSSSSSYGVEMFNENFLIHSIRMFIFYAQCLWELKNYRKSIEMYRQSYAVFKKYNRPDFALQFYIIVQYNALLKLVHPMAILKNNHNNLRKPLAIDTNRYECINETDDNNHNDDILMTPALSSSIRTERKLIFIDDEPSPASSTTTTTTTETLATSLSSTSSSASASSTLSLSSASTTLKSTSIKSSLIKKPSTKKEKPKCNVIVSTTASTSITVTDAITTTPLSASSSTTTHRTQRKLIAKEKITITATATKSTATTTVTQKTNTPTKIPLRTRAATKRK